LPVARRNADNNDRKNGGLRLLYRGSQGLLFGLQLAILPRPHTQTL